MGTTLRQILPLELGRQQRMKILHFLNDFWPSLQNRRCQFLVMDRVPLGQLRVSHHDRQRVVDVVLQGTETLADG